MAYQPASRSRAWSDGPAMRRRRARLWRPAGRRICPPTQSAAASTGPVCGRMTLCGVMTFQHLARAERPAILTHPLTIMRTMRHKQPVLLIRHISTVGMRASRASSVHGVGELELRSELVGDDQRLARSRHGRSGDDVVTVDGDGSVRAGGERRVQQDLAGGGVERVEVAVVGGGEDDIVGDGGGAVRR